MSPPECPSKFLKAKWSGQAKPDGADGETDGDKDKALKLLAFEKLFFMLDHHRQVRSIK